MPEAGLLADAAAAVLDVPAGPVPEAAAAVRDGVGRRPLVALGGGRVIDATKAVASVEGLRCAAVPTTLSGAEMTRLHRLPAGIERPLAGLVRPEVVIADPGAMTSQPAAALAASAINALAHGAEAAYGPRTNPAVQAAALRGAELIALGLESPEAGGVALAVGAVLCAWSLDIAGLGLHHALCQSIVRTAGTPHAETNAVVLPHVLRYVAAHAGSEIGRLAVALGAGAAEPGEAAVRAAELAPAGGPTRLSELGVTEGDLERIADQAGVRPELATTPGSPGRDALAGILRAAV